jgi:hypothetical protein
MTNLKLRDTGFAFDLENFREAGFALCAVKARDARSRRTSNRAGTTA